MVAVILFILKFFEQKFEIFKGVFDFLKVNLNQTKFLTVN